MAATACSPCSTGRTSTPGQPPRSATRAALGKPVVGIRLDLRRTGDPGSLVNGQVEHFAVRTGGAVLSCPPAELTAPRAFVDRAVRQLLAALQ